MFLKTCRSYCNASPLLFYHSQTPELTDKEILAQAEPHIAKYRGSTVVIKYGGHAMENEDLKAKFASDIVLLKQVSPRTFNSPWPRRHGNDH